MKINQLDLFSGIGGFHKGFEKAGYEVTSYFSEIDKYAVAVYQHQFKSSTYVGSVTDFHGGDLPRIDLITFGSPCQDFSLAGKRQGMDGERSSLILEAIRLIKQCRPRVFIWENVKGTFSSNAGADFAGILQAFADIGGYDCEWQLLNTAWFLPQNRERVYLVGYLAETRRDWRGVFPLIESSGEDGEVECTGRPVSKTLTARGQASLHSGMQLVEMLTPKVSNYSPREVGFKQISPTLLARDYKDPKVVGYSRDKHGEVVNRTLKDEANTIHGSTGSGGNTDQFVKYGRIRRLTPIECERLQGFPDNHTLYGVFDGEVKEISKTQRYKQCGNAVTVDVVQAIAEKIKPLFQ
jgi:DNA (cytosine-5)-methyltransferase 1